MHRRRHKLQIGSAVAAVLFLLLATASTVRADERVITFDPPSAPPPGTPLVAQYHDLGVDFTAAGDAEFPIVTDVGGQAYSGTQVAAQGCSVEFCANVTRARFTTTHAFVRVRVGHYGPVGASSLLTLYALDAGGDVIDQDATTVSGGAGFGATLEVASASGAIAGFILRPPGPARTLYGFDDLAFDVTNTPPGPDFSVATESVAGAALRQGFDTAVPIRLQRVNGSAGRIGFEISPLPPGISHSFTPATTTGDSAVLRLVATPNAQLVDAAPITVTARPQDATAGPVARSTTFQLRVAANFALRDVVAAVPACANVEVPIHVEAPGAGGGFSLMPIRFTGPIAVAVRAADLPAGVTVTVAPASLTLDNGQAVSTAVVRAVPGALTATRVVTVQATATPYPPATARLTLSPAPGPATCALPPTGDLDGDGLTNATEENGLTIGGRRLDLRSMGADPRHKDLFVQLDAMAPHRLAKASIDAVLDAFARAPVTNPDGQTGIHLHVDNGASSTMNPVTHATWGQLSRSRTVSHDAVLGAMVENKDHQKQYDWAEYAAIKKAGFPAERVPVFRYALSAHRWGESTQDSSGLTRELGGDFMVTLGRECGTQDCSVVGVAAEAGTFMHELGHSLGIGHDGGGAWGGGDGVNYKPNYLSLMNYRWQLSGLLRSLSPGTPAVLDYSRFGSDPAAGGIESLDEQALRELPGLRGGFGPQGYVFEWNCPGGKLVGRSTVGAAGTDWNCDGKFAASDQRVSNVDADGTGTPAPKGMTSYDDWAHVRYVGGALAGAGTPRYTPITDWVPLGTLRRLAAQARGDTRAPRLTARITHTGGRTTVRLTARDSALDSLIVTLGGRRRTVKSADGASRLEYRRTFRGKRRPTLQAVAFDLATNSSRRIVVRTR